MKLVFHKLFMLLVSLKAVKLSIVSLSEPMDQNKNTENVYKTILSQMNEEKNVQAILVLSSDYTECRGYQDFLAIEDYPKMLLTANTSMHYYKDKHNNQILAMACLESIFDISMIARIAERIEYMRNARVLLLVHKQSTDISNKDLEIMRIFESCQNFYMQNALLWFEDFDVTLTFYQFTQFPRFQLVKRLYAKNMTEPVYPNRMRDLKGYELRTLADHIEARSMEYFDKNGNLQLNGYVGRFVRAFAKKHNARLVFPYPVKNNEIIFYRDFLQFMRNFSLDIPTSITNMLIGGNIQEFSYPFELATWCIMLPVEEPIEFNLLYFTILRSNFMTTAFVLIAVFTVVLFIALVQAKPDILELNWSKFLLNDMAVRGVLGQSFLYYVSDHSHVLTLIFCCIFATGLTINTLFGAYLQSFLTQTPSEPFVHNYQDMLNTNRKILISENEYSYLMNYSIIDMTPYRSIFKILPTFAEFTDIRDTFNRSYAYPVATSKWPFYKGKQDFHSVKIMRFSSEMCSTPVLQLCFALSLNSIFREPLEKLILEVHQAGLLSHWLANTYNEVVQTGRNVKMVISYPPPHRPLVVWDFYWIWILYLSMISCCLLMFGMEALMGLYRKHYKKVQATDYLFLIDAHFDLDIKANSNTLTNAGT